MRKTLLYIAILAVLCAGIYYLLPGNNSNDNPYDPSEAGFNVKDTGALGKIFMAASHGESITLDRTDSGWIVNQQYKVLPSSLNMLLNTLVKQSPLYPVTKNAFDNVVKTMATHGTKVELYDRSGKKTKVFYVGGAAVNNTGTNMLMEGATKPYVVEAPGFVGYLTPRYSTKLRDWRDRTVFNVPADDIKSISVKYYQKAENSFTVARDEQDSINVMADAKVMRAPDGLNKNRAAMYLRFFNNINCEGYLNGLEDNDTTFKTAPKHSSIELITKKGKVQHLDIYWMAVNKRSKNQKSSDIDSLSGDYDSDRFYAVMNNYKDTILIQQLTFQNILRKAPEFYKKDVPKQVPSANQSEIKQSAATR